jgi:hypothetical protein
MSCFRGVGPGKGGLGGVAHLLNAYHMVKGVRLLEGVGRLTVVGAVEGCWRHGVTRLLGPSRRSRSRAGLRSQLPQAFQARSG